jgi:hypothetical protein
MAEERVQRRLAAILAVVVGDGAHRPIPHPSFSVAINHTE